MMTYMHFFALTLLDDESPGSLVTIVKGPVLTNSPELLCCAYLS
jgi:hypothetical protein